MNRKTTTRNAADNAYAAAIKHGLQAATGKGLAITAAILAIAALVTAAPLAVTPLAVAAAAGSIAGKLATHQVNQYSLNG
jgi:hypothetical protein